MKREKKIQMVDVVGEYQRYRNEIDSVVQEVLASGQYIQGKYVREFELAMATFLDVRHAIGCANGTDALQLCLMSLNVQPGDEIITTPFTFAATTETIVLLGARPVYVDIDLQTYNIDPEQIEGKISSKTKAILPVHLYGQPANMSRIREIGTRYHIPVIEDAAQAVGSKWDNVRAGSIGDLGSISFYPSKNLGAFGDGGMVVTNDDQLAEHVRTIANHGCNRPYHHDRVGINSRLDALQAAILNVKLKYLDEWNAERRRIAGWYNEIFEGKEGITLPLVDSRATPIWHQYTLYVHHDRDGLGSELRSQNIPCNIYYPISLHLQMAYNDGSYTKGDFPKSESASEHVLSLPMHASLTREEVEVIGSAVLQSIKDVAVI